MYRATPLWHAMENTTIATAGEQIMMFRHLRSYRLNVRNLINNYLPQTIDQFISTYAKRIDF